MSKYQVVLNFLRPQENVTPDAGRQPPDRILARLKSPFLYGRGISMHN